MDILETSQIVNEKLSQAHFPNFDSALPTHRRHLPPIHGLDTYPWQQILNEGYLQLDLPLTRLLCAKSHDSSCEYSAGVWLVYACVHSAAQLQPYPSDPHSWCVSLASHGDVLYSYHTKKTRTWGIRQKIINLTQDKGNITFSRLTLLHWHLHSMDNQTSITNVSLVSKTSTKHSSSQRYKM